MEKEKRKPIRITKKCIKSAFAKAAKVMENPVKQLNVSLIEVTADAIEVSPRYDQEHWAEVSHRTPCGTTCCIGGEFLLQSKFTVEELLVLADIWKLPGDLSSYALNVRGNYPIIYNANNAVVFEVACALSGISKRLANKLFEYLPSKYWHKRFAKLYEQTPNLAAARYLRAIAAGRIKL